MKNKKLARKERDAKLASHGIDLEELDKQLHPANTSRKLLTLHLFENEAGFVLDFLSSGGLSLASIRGGGAQYIAALNKQLKNFLED